MVESRDGKSEVYLLPLPPSEWQTLLINRLLLSLDPFQASAPGSHMKQSESAYAMNPICHC